MKRLMFAVVAFGSMVALPAAAQNIRVLYDDVDNSYSPAALPSSASPGSSTGSSG